MRKSNRNIELTVVKQILRKAKLAKDPRFRYKNSSEDTGV